jgi:hypothetical protein
MEEVRQLVCTGREREKMWMGLQSFLVHANVAANFSHLNLVGPFISRHRRPRAIDLVLQTRAPYGPAAFAALHPFFAFGLAEIRQRYGVRLHFWIEGAPPSLRFMGGHRSQASWAALPRLIRRGIVCIELEAGCGGVVPRAAR